MTQLKESTKKSPNPLQYLRYARWSFFILGMGCFFLCILTAIFPPENKSDLLFTTMLLIPIGAIASMSSETVHMIHRLMLERFREIDKLKSKVQELEDKLAQK